MEGQTIIIIVFVLIILSLIVSVGYIYVEKNNIDKSNKNSKIEIDKLKKQKELVDLSSKEMENKIKLIENDQMSLKENYDKIKIEKDKLGTENTDLKTENEQNKPKVTAYNDIEELKIHHLNAGDGGYADAERGYYNIQGLGCINYCRWVGSPRFFSCVTYDKNTKTKQEYGGLNNLTVEQVRTKKCRDI